MSEEPHQQGADDGSAGPVDPTEQKADGAGSADTPRKGLLPKKRERRDRPKRERPPRPERSKKRLFGGSREEQPTEAIPPDAATTGRSPAAEEQPQSQLPYPAAPASEERTDPVPTDEPAKPRKRGLLPKRKTADTPARTPDEPGVDGPATDGASAAPDAQTASEPRRGKAKRPREKRPPREKKPRPKRPPRAKKPKAERAERADRPAPASTLRRERRALLASRQDAAYHLGGLAFELYRRDLLQDGVLRQRAVEVAALDDRIREIDRQLGERTARAPAPAGAPGAAQAGPAGNCLVCRSEFVQDARFCSNCGARFVPEAAESEQVTSAIEIPTDAARG